MAVKPIPEGFARLSPHIVVRDAKSAIEFYKKAFGAEEVFRMPAPDGNLIMHAELKIGDSRLMLCDEMPMGNCGCRSPQSLGGTSVTLHLYAEDADAVVDRAAKAGATVIMPVMDAFWGDRYGRIADPFGHEWSIATHTKDLTEQEIKEAADKCFASAPA